MSILMMMVGEQMPTTSDYVPLFGMHSPSEHFTFHYSGIFYLSIIFIIFIGTLFTAFILNVHLQKTHNKPIPPLISYLFFHKVAPMLGIRPPTVLLELWRETGVRIRGMDVGKTSRSDHRKRTPPSILMSNAHVKKPVYRNNSGLPNGGQEENRVR